MMALMKLFPIIPAKWIMEMDVCRDFKQNKTKSFLSFWIKMNNNNNDYFLGWSQMPGKSDKGKHFSLPF